METRVGRLEGVVETLTRDVQEVARSVGALGREIGNLRDIFAEKFDQVAERVGDAARPNWGNIAAWAAVIVTMVGLAGSLVAVGISGLSGSVTEVKARVSVVEDRACRDQYEKGKSDAISSESVSKLRELDSKLQREMQLLNNTTEARVTALDNKLQTEFGNITRFLDRQVADNTAAIADFRAWRLDHIQGNAEVHGRIDADLKATKEKLGNLDDRQWAYRTDRLKAHEAEDIKLLHKGNRK